MIEEPTWWEVHCDHRGCREEFEVEYDSYVTEKTIARDLKQENWTVVNGYMTYCPDHKPEAQIMPFPEQP